MKLSEFEEHLITEEMPVGASGSLLRLTWDANLFVGEVGRRMARVYRECAESVEAKTQNRAGGQPRAARGGRRPTGTTSLAQIADELAASMEMNAALESLDARMYAEVLACDRYGILKDWDMQDDEGRHVAPTYDVLVKRRGAILKSLFEFCREQSLPKKQEAGTPPSQETSLTTSSTINDGSSPQIIPAPESPATSQTST